MSGYLKQIDAAYQRTLEREALLAGLAGCCQREDRRAKLEVLQCLEIESRALLGSILADQVPPRRPSSGIRRQVRALADRRWIEFVDALFRELTPQIARLEHLERSASASDRTALARVTAHLVALQSFARLEVAGKARESVLPALVLIGQCVDPLPLGIAAG